MEKAIESYQDLPQLIDPIIFSIGSFNLRWYSVMYLVGFLAVYFLLRYRVNKNEAQFSDLKFNIIDLLLYALLGVLIGGRLGYVIIYDFQYFLHNPIAVISPFGSGGTVMGLWGMSFHGGLIGVVLAGIIFSKNHKLDFWKLANFIIPAVPLGYFFGRIGNFLNGELYGRVTEREWGMYFQAGSLRHPSQLYEAFFEGIVLFLILWIIRNNPKFLNKLFAIFLFGYGLFRFFLEFFREPDFHIGFVFGFLTMGQILSLFMIIFAGIIFLRKK